MGLLARTGLALKAAGRALAVPFTGAWSAGWSFVYRGSRVSYADVDPTQNSAVMACILWVCRAFPEAPLRFGKLAADGSVAWQHTHELVKLLRKPNPYYSGDLLMQATLIDYNTTGNAYWLKERSAAGRVVGLWWVPQWMIEPRWSRDGSDYISHYDYTVNGKIEKYSPDDVIHFRFGLDPQNIRKGLSPLASVLREIYGDDEAANFSAALLRNMGIPGVIIAPDAAEERIGETDAKEIARSFGDKFGGDNRGAPMVMPSRIKVTPLSLSPEEMTLTSLRRLPEERVSAVLGVPAMLVGLGAGLDRSTYSNMQEAREAAWQNNLLPTHRILSGALLTQLAPDFVPDPDNWTLSFDVSQVRALQEDEDSRWRRVDQAVRGGWLMVGAAQRMVGIDAGDELNYYLRSPFQVALRGDEIGAVAVSLPTTPTAKALIDAQAKTLALPSGVQVKAEPDTAALAQVREDLIVAYRALLDEWMRDLTSRVNALVLAGTRDPVALIAVSDDLSLQALAEAFYAGQVGQATAAWVMAELEIDNPFNLGLARVQATARELAQRVTGINETTRTALQDTIATAFDKGYSLHQLAYGVPADGYGGIAGVMADASGYRLDMIALTETGNAMNLTQLDYYEASGRVETVRVYDGDYDAVCQAANGQEWTLAHARGNALAHPNCRRSFAAILKPAPEGDSAA